MPFGCKVSSHSQVLIVIVILTLLFSGALTAEKMYGYREYSPSDKSKAWLTNAFTDITLRSYPMGDLQWAVCPTCGAWLSTQLFDYLLYNKFESSDTVDELFHILKGAVKFLLAYIQQTDGICDAFSGPSTSPENSYKLMDTEGN